jgi:LPXTG-motif cell wall-anchored protein
LFSDRPSLAATSSVMSRCHACFAAIAAAVALAVAPGSAGARWVAAEPPPGCRPYSDAGDYACAGLELPFHTSGTSSATSDIWAGQWLFTDEAGNYRVGSCTFNRGLHPRADDPAHRIEQALPNDPGHRKSAYLTWRYGATTDHLTAAALWAIFHYYAQDPAGSARAADPGSPLVPSLDMVAHASGRADLQQRAIELDAEATRYAGPFRMRSSVAGTTVTVSVVVNGNGVPGVPVIIGGAALVTDAAGNVTVEAPAGATVSARASIPGAPAVYLAAPLRPHQYGGQSLITAGPPDVNETAATVPPPPATTTTTSTTVAPTTTTTAPITTTTTTTTSPTTTSTSTAAPTTSSTSTTSTTSTTTVPPTTGATTLPPTTEVPTVPPTDTPTTAPPETSTSTSVVVEVVPPPLPPSAPPPSTLPETGGTETIAAAAALVLGAGVGALVGLRRRLQASPPAADEFWT